MTSDHVAQRYSSVSQSVCWVGLTLPATDSIQRVEPLEIAVFATERAAQAWMRDMRVGATGPMRYIYEREVQS